ncbi:hypothetical protein TRFO_25164 [Tritrichomonas foetus]|uniref:RING-type domain-containing protein n=1 Tax=Tritrichomonas foetus TaxID=1144522 RepID=A0A1J4K727_9EUKA|nr:hypothetical protein TRFO_25164 [Tritrichomonas foetus]|eukprot:OHT06704.1 hypothetical protein TRFO_25164 [Tritrichomonas foetus]
MGCNLCHPLQEPVWFSYYGPIRQAEAADAINAAIADHLQEIGQSNIPIRRVVASHLTVPVALNNPAFTEITDSTITVSFSSASSGKITLQTETSSETAEYGVGLQSTQEFKRPIDDQWTLKFDFDQINGVTCRMYTLHAHNNQDPTVVDDKMVIDGVISTISRVFRQQGVDGDDGFSDGLCLICCSETASVVAFPCRHCCMCRECSERFATMSSHCPVCRAPVTELIECVTEENSIAAGVIAE